MVSNSLSDCHPELAKKAELLIEKCKRAGIYVCITCTYRDSDAQDWLMSHGRTLPGALRTVLKGGESKHSNVDENGNPCSLAFDFYPTILGKASLVSKSQAKYVGIVAEALGLKWGGRNTNTAVATMDIFHIEMEDLEKK
jgi:peptidoglycan L-alanyl-D-glutamate endopeptidase CwlK